MRAVRVIGPSGAGKTTLIERLVGALPECGRVATVKSIHHDVEVDDEGTDTHRHRIAGAERVIGITPSLSFSVEARGKDDAPDEPAALDRLLADLQDRGYAYALVEGFSAASGLPAIAVGDHHGVDDAVLVATVVDPASNDLDRLVGVIERLEPWECRE